MTTKYPEERRDAIINKMLPPLSMSIPELSKLENIPRGTLYTWKQLYIAKHPDCSSKPSIGWSAEQKLAAIIETSTLSDQERSEYCRKNGLYHVDLESWKSNFIKGTEKKVAQDKTDKNELKHLRSENNKLKVVPTETETDLKI